MTQKRCNDTFQGSRQQMLIIRYFQLKTVVDSENIHIIDDLTVSLASSQVLNRSMAIKHDPHIRRSLAVKSCSQILRTTHKHVS